jgi:hypothetical protein
MTQIHSRYVLLASLLTVAAGVVGCQGQSGGTDANAARALAEPGPEESFELIVETFRRGIEDVPIGFVLHNSEGHSMMTGRNEVSHELIRPTKDGEPYRAVITVGSQSRYSIQRSTSDEEESDEADEQPSDPLAEEGEESDLQLFDRELVGPGSAKQDRQPPPSTKENAEKTVTRQADKQERKYELVYENGKWTLVTKLDPETEQSIQNAFKRALEMQI